ncbi:MAG: thioredoxin-like domain-containing protein [Planctomycetia bacterium]|nr:thioredoxin-like domain-containing protein [Planctomycetia bacterium]
MPSGTFRRRLAATVIFLAAVGLDGRGGSDVMAQVQNPFPRRLDVPPLPKDLAWLNTARPLSLDELRGKFVLIDFWTYCCINCMHILPELKKLEEAYPKDLVVIGVHSAKFETEKDAKNITEAILRYEIRHPVVVDSRLEVWKLFEAQSWPTVVLIDPEGKAVWGQSGEITMEQVRDVLSKAIPYYRRLGLLNEKPLEFQLEAAKVQVTPLRFPSKVLADEAGGRLFIADSNHNRIAVARLDGTLVETIGSGAIGRADGDFATAEFNKPQGMALVGETLYVADTENHLIRAVDLAKREVKTLAGTGGQNRKPAETLRPSIGRRTALNSPWALWVHGERLYVAMAGAHQIWRMTLDGESIGPYAGNGREDIVDGPLLPERLYSLGSSSFAQPSGLASDGVWLFVADSEGSSIRAVPLDGKGSVRTVVGTSELANARLFTFGDVDGPPGRARLQHPLGIVYYRDRLYVADTYNNKIKVIDPASGEVKPLVGTGISGAEDDPPSFNEPAGISAAAGRLFVADTNSHLIRVIDLDHENRVSTLSIGGLNPPAGGNRR